MPKGCSRASSWKPHRPVRSCSPIPSRRTSGSFPGVTCVAPNSAEATAIAGIPIVDDASLERAGVRLIESLDCRYAIITRGEHGMALFGRAGERLQIPSVARTVYDVSGAGDTVDRGARRLALAAGAPIEQAMQLANFAAGAVVAKLGTATASPEEILALLDSPT